MTLIEWLIKNEGKYEILKDNSYWTDEHGKTFLNKISMSYKGTMKSCNRGGIVEAVEYFSKMDEGLL